MSWIHFPKQHQIHRGHCHKVPGSDCSHHFRDLSHDHLSLLLCNANMLLGHCSYLSSGRQKPDHILLWCPYIILRDQQVYLSGNNPAQEMNWGVHTDNVRSRKVLEQEAAAASSACKVRKCAVWAEQSLNWGKGAAHTPGMGRKKEAGEWQTQQEEVLEEIQKRSSLQSHRLQDVTWEHSVPWRLAAPVGADLLPVAFTGWSSDGLHSTACSAWSCLTRGCEAHTQLQKCKHLDVDVQAIFKVYHFTTEMPKWKSKALLKWELRAQ